MLNRILSILLIPIVLICTSGGVVFMDKCSMMKIPSYSLVAGKKCCCSKSKNARCCKETKIVIKKIEDNYSSPVSANIPLAKSLPFTFPILYPTPLFDISVTNCILAFDHAPPNLSSISIPVKYRSLLI